MACRVAFRADEIVETTLTILPVACSSLGSLRYRRDCRDSGDAGSETWGKSPLNCVILEDNEQVCDKLLTNKAREDLRDNLRHTTGVDLLVSH